MTTLTILDYESGITHIIEDFYGNGMEYVENNFGGDVCYMEKDGDAKGVVNYKSYNEIIDELHGDARDFMTETKDTHTLDDSLSLDEFLHLYNGILSEDETEEGYSLLKKF
jgi:hypothetical protein